MLCIATMLSLQGVEAAQPAQPGKAASTAEVTYLVLLGEMQLVAQEHGAGYSLLLEAAQKSADPQIYQRAINTALEVRAIDAAVDAARAWATAMPTAPDPQKTLTQLLLASNKVEQSAASLDKLLNLIPAAERSVLIDQVAQTYVRVPDKATAQRVVTTALKTWVNRADTAASAWAAQGTLALGSGLHTQSLGMLEKALANPVTTSAPGILAIELLNAKVLAAGPLLQTYLAQPHAIPVAVRLAYMRHLLSTAQNAEAYKQVEIAVAQYPEEAEPWLVLGTLNLQNGKADLAETQLLQFLKHTEQRNQEQKPNRSLAQAYFSLAQIAENRLQLDAATAWLERIELPEENIRVQIRLASLLAKRGKVDEARLLIQQTPLQQPSDARVKLLAEVQLLKDAGRLADAAAALADAVNTTEDDVELIYEQALLAEKLGHMDEMERLLKTIIARKPDHTQAYNALGYALAERNTRLPEAKALIMKALEMAPGDPFITDSLGWVEYRLGNLPTAVDLLIQAFNKRPDIEIAIHLAEVLWVKGDRDVARAYFKRAHELQPDNPLLQETVKRLGVPH